MKMREKWSIKTSATRKEIQSLVGKLSFVTNCVRPGRIFLCRILQVLRDMKGDRACISEEFQDDITWWRNFLPTFDSISLLWLFNNGKDNSIIAMDACLEGGGGTFETEFFHFKFLQHLKDNTTHISQLELFTLYISVRLWATRLAGKVIRITTDNQATMWSMLKVHLVGSNHRMRVQMTSLESPKRNSVQMGA